MLANVLKIWSGAVDAQADRLWEDLTRDRICYPVGFMRKLENFCNRRRLDFISIQRSSIRFFILE